MPRINSAPADDVSAHYRELIRQNSAFCRAIYVALQAGSETADGMTATVRIGVAKTGAASLLPS
jgi:hypothetical protein